MAQGFDYDRYAATTLQTIADEWDKTTSNYEPGLSILTPALTVRLDVTAIGTSTNCSNETLGFVFKVLGLNKALKEVAINRCITIAASSNSPPITVYIQDSLTEAYDEELSNGGKVSLYALFLAYRVSKDHKNNAPVLIVNAFKTSSIEN